MTDSCGAKVYRPPYRCGIGDCESQCEQQHRPGRGVVESASGNVRHYLYNPIFLFFNDFVSSATSTDTVSI